MFLFHLPVLYYLSTLYLPTCLPTCLFRFFALLLFKILRTCSNNGKGEKNTLNGIHRVKMINYGRKSNQATSVFLFFFFSFYGNRLLLMVSLFFSSMHYFNLFARAPFLFSLACFSKLFGGLFDLFSFLLLSCLLNVV